MQNQTLTVRETAQLMGCTLKYVFDLLHAGMLPGARKVEKRWRIPAQTVQERLSRKAQQEHIGQQSSL